MNKKKKQWVILGVLVLVFCALIAGVLFWYKNRNSDEAETDRFADESVLDETASSITEADTSLSEGSVSVEDVLKQAADYDSIYNSMAAYYNGMYSDNAFSNLTAEQDFFSDGEDWAEYDEEYDYEITNVISFTEVSEYQDVGDVCKTDGAYAYLVRNDSGLRIMSLNGSVMESANVISEYTHEMENLMDFYIQDNRLMMITTYTEILDAEQGQYQEGTIVYTYDVTDPVSPAIMGSVEIEGFYMDSKMTNAGLCVYTNCYKDGFVDQQGELIDMADVDMSAIVPTADGAVLSADSVYMANKVTDTSYMVTALIDPENPDQVQDAKAFLSVDSQFYAGENSLYLTIQNGLYEVRNTVIVRLDFTNGKIEPAVAGVVDGYVMGISAMSEKDGSLRVLSTGTTENGSENYLYILDEQLGISAKADNVAAGQSIQSVRYINDEVYLAVYGETPIVTIDLAEGSQMKETAAAKPEGFEGLLYPFGENQILGLSYILNEETTMYEGIRLTMFDVTDSSNITVVDTVTVAADSTPAVSYIDSLYLNLEKGLIGFPTEDWDENYTEVDNFYRLYSYSAEAGFQSVLEARLGAGSCWYARGFAAGETFYVAEQDSGNLRSFDMANGYSQTGEMYY